MHNWSPLKKRGDLEEENTAILGVKCFYTKDKLILQLVIQEGKEGPSMKKRAL